MKFSILHILVFTALIGVLLSLSPLMEYGFGMTAKAMRMGDEQWMLIWSLRTVVGLCCAGIVISILCGLGFLAYCIVKSICGD